MVTLSNTEAFEELRRCWAYAEETGPNGEFSFPPLSYGEWVLLASAEGHDRARLEVTVGAQAPSEQLVWRMPAESCWSVVVRNSEGVTVPDASLEVGSFHEGCHDVQKQELVTGEDGSALVCGIDAWASTVTARATGLTKDFIRTFEDTDEVTITLEPAAALKGRFVPFKPADGPGFTLAAGGGRMDFDVQEDGTFFLDHVRTGENRGSIHTNCGSYLPVESFDLKPGEVRDLGEIELVPNGTRPEHCEEP